MSRIRAFYIVLELKGFLYCLPKFYNFGFYILVHDPFFTKVEVVVHFLSMAIQLFEHHLLRRLSLY